MENNRRRELKEEYRNRTVIGGVYRIVNRENGRFYLRSTDDIKATRNIIAMWEQFGHCSLPPIQQDWKAYGTAAFYLDELELLEKQEAQTDKEFKSDLKVLLEIWDENLPRDNRY